MLRLLSAEWLKLRRSVIWVLLPVSPLLAFAIAWLAPLDSDGQSQWAYALSIASTAHGLLFLPLLTGIIAALLCRFEHAGGGWKLLLSLPLRRSQLYLAKLAAILGLLLLLQALFAAAIVAGGLLRGIEEPAPWGLLARSMLGGWAACLPLAAMQLWAASVWTGFAAPLALNVIFTLPNLLVINSERFAPLYPWTQPMLAMLPSSGADGAGTALAVDPATLFGVVGGSFALFLLAGLGMFLRRTA